MADWEETSIAIPASERDTIPSEAEVWACWKKPSEAVTIYTTGEHEWYVAADYRSYELQINKFDAKEAAVGKAKQLRAQ